MRGVWPLIKLILRRDRIKLPIWIFMIVIMMVSLPLAMHATAGTPQELAGLQAQFQSGSAVMNLITGPFQMINGKIGLGGLTLVKAELFTAVLMAFFATLLVVRHTRQNEELGATELIESAEVSRFAPLTAAIIVSLASIILIVILSALGIIFTVGGIAGGWGVGAPSVTSGAWLFSLEIGGVGLSFTAIAAVVSQLTDTSSSANSILGVIIGITYILRGIGDVIAKNAASGMPKMNVWSWLSPFGWGEATHSLTFAKWEYLWVPIIFSALLIPFSYFLLSRRDLGSGLLPSRRGRTHASGFLLSQIGLTWKLQRNIFLGWLIGSILLVAVIGGVANQITTVYSGSSAMKQTIQSLGGTSGALSISALLSGILVYVVLLVVAYCLQSLVKTRYEEASGHLENILATKTSRINWLLKHVVFAIIGAIVILMISGFVTALSANISGVTPALNLWDYSRNMLAYLPVAVAFVGIYVLCFGIIPRLATAVSWLLYVALICVEMFLSLFAALFHWSDSVKNFLPLQAFTKIFSGIANSNDWLAYLLTALIAVFAIILGLFFWRRRNIASDE